MILPRFALPLALSSILATVPIAPAWATPEPGKPRPAAPAAGAEDRAAHLLQVGNKAFKDGNFAEAEEAYRGAFTLKRGYDIAGNLGMAELAQNKPRACAEHLAFTLRLFPVTGEPALREQIAKALDQCRRGVGALRVELPVHGATIFLDGAPVGEAPLLDEVFVDPGEHVLEARLDGYTGTPVRVAVVPGDAALVTLALAPVPPPEKTIVRIVPAHHRNLVPGLALGAGAIVGLATGAALLGASAAKRSDISTLRGQILQGRGSCVQNGGNYDAARCPSLLSAARAEDTLDNAATGAFIIGGVAAAAAATWLFWPQRPASSGPDLRVSPTVGPGGGAVFVTGSF